MQYVHGAKCTVWTRARYEGEWRCLRRRVRGLDRLHAAFDLDVLDRLGAALDLDGLDRLRAAFDLDVLDRLGAALDLDGLDRLGATYPPVAFDPEALWH